MDASEATLTLIGGPTVLMRFPRTHLIRGSLATTMAALGRALQITYDLSG
jgi:hypothetical protein